MGMSEAQIEADYMVSYFRLMEKHQDPEKIIQAAKETEEAWQKFQRGCADRLTVRH